MHTPQHSYCLFILSLFISEKKKKKKRKCSFFLTLLFSSHKLVECINV